VRATVDTNVIVSALISEGSPPDIVMRSWRAQAFGLVTSRPLLAELERVLGRAHIRARVRLPENEIREYLDLLHDQSIIVAPDQNLDAVPTDPADNRVLEAALAGEADYIVSGDADLLGLGEYEGTRVVTPARFLAVLAEAGYDRTV
jgi:putative PIN family toxin of toxin-antitoxin system